VFFAAAVLELDEAVAVASLLLVLRRKSELMLARRRRERLEVELASSREAIVTGEDGETAVAVKAGLLVTMVGAVVMNAPVLAVVDVVAVEAVVPEPDPTIPLLPIVPAVGVVEWEAEVFVNPWW
jgi:hypothetical protein